MRLRRLRNERAGYVKQIVTRRLDARRDQAMLARAEEIAARGGVVPVELRDMHVQHSFVRAADKYVLRPWDGHVVLMRAEQAGFEADGLGHGVRLGRGRRRAASTSSPSPATTTPSCSSPTPPRWSRSCAPRSTAPRAGASTAGPPTAGPPPLTAGSLTVAAPTAGPPTAGSADRQTADR